MGKTKLILSNIVIALVVNIILNFVFIPMNQIGFIENELGINGAALATVISMSLFNLMIILQSKHFLGVFPFRRKMITIGIVSLIPIIIMSYFKRFMEVNMINMILLLSLFFLTYGALVLISKGLDKNDLEVIFSGMKKFKKNL